MAVTTIRKAQELLADSGYTEVLVADGPKLTGQTSGARYDPANLKVERLIRFQGVTAPDEEALLFALSTGEGEPVGTYTPSYLPSMTDEDLAVVEKLHERVIPDEELTSHTRHDHVAAVFDGRQVAQAAVDELRRYGLGTDRLGVAVRQGETLAFERDAENELVHEGELGMAAGAAGGFLTGMTVAAVALVPGGLLGLGGILAIGAGVSIPGAMLGGYLGMSARRRAFDEREELAEVHLEPDQVLVAVCSHGHHTTVENILRQHGGELVLRPRTPHPHGR